MINIIKYKNRKLYHSAARSYITLSDIQYEMSMGSKVVVMDNETKEDITQEILLQVLAKHSKLNTDQLTSLISKGTL